MSSGHGVTIYDSHAKAGRILQCGIPAYRLPKDSLNKILELFKRLRLKFAFKTLIGRDLSFKTRQKHNDAVFFAVGAQKDVELEIPARELDGVIQGYEFIEGFAGGKNLHLGKKVIVVGVGNVAIDAARSCLCLGADVTIVCRRGRHEMPAGHYGNRTRIRRREPCAKNSSRHRSETFRTICSARSTKNADCPFGFRTERKRKRRNELSRERRHLNAAEAHCGM